MRKRKGGVVLQGETVFIPSEEQNHNNQPVSRNIERELTKNKYPLPQKINKTKTLPPFPSQHDIPIYSTKSHSTTNITKQDNIIALRNRQQHNNLVCDENRRIKSGLGKFSCHNVKCRTRLSNNRFQTNIYM